MWNWKQRCIEDKSTRTGCSSLPCKFCYVCVNEWYAWHMDCCSHAVPFRISSETELDVFLQELDTYWHSFVQHTYCVIVKGQANPCAAFQKTLIWRCHNACKAVMAYAMYTSYCASVSVHPQASQRAKDQNRSDGHWPTAKQHKTVLQFALHQAWHWPSARHLKFMT